MATSFFRYVKPWLQHQPDFDKPGNLHLGNLYDFWSLFWAADTKTISDLPYWEHEVRDISMSYIRLGLALHAIRLKLSSGNKNWRQIFEDFCQNTPVGSSSYAKKIIKAASVAIDLINEGFSKLPSCVSQALPLAKFSASLASPTGASDTDSSELSQKWQQVLDSAPRGRVTSAHVKVTCENGSAEEKPAIVRIRKFKKNLADEARERGISQQELIEEILAERYQERSEEEAAEEILAERYQERSEEEAVDEESAVRRSDELTAEEEYTREQVEILDQLDAEFQENAAAVEDLARTDKPVVGFGMKRPLKSHQKAINRANRSGKESDSS